MSETIFILEREDRVAKDLWLDLDTASFTEDGCRALERRANIRRGAEWTKNNPGFRVREGTWAAK